MLLLKFRRLVPLKSFRPFPLRIINRTALHQSTIFMVPIPKFGMPWVFWETHYFFTSLKIILTAEILNIFVGIYILYVKAFRTQLFCSKVTKILEFRA